MPEQASEVAAALASSLKPHCYFFADFAAGLLAAGRSVETDRLRDALEGSKAGAFSGDAKSALLARLRNEAKSLVDPAENLLHAYAVMSARFFAEAEFTDPSRPDLRTDILSLDVPALLAMDRGRTMIGQAIDLTLAEQFQRTAREVVARGRLRADELQRLNAFLGQLRSRQGCLPAPVLHSLNPAVINQLNTHRTLFTACRPSPPGCTLSLHCPIS